jgi:hypothetical protein
MHRFAAHGQLIKQGTKCISQTQKGCVETNQLCDIYSGELSCYIAQNDFFLSEDAHLVT